MAKRIFKTLLLLVICLLSFSLLSAKDITLLTANELKGILGNGDVIVIDVRSDQDWARSELKIQGALRENPLEVGSWAQNYSPEKTIALYCA
jgi:rhodanese-related sulfurtransferase